MQGDVVQRVSEQSLTRWEPQRHGPVAQHMCSPSTWDLSPREARSCHNSRVVPKSRKGGGL